MPRLGGCLLGVTAILISTLIACAPPAPVYPSKPVTLIVPYAPGGTSDLIARALAQSMQPYFPQPLVIVNHPGAQATVGETEVLNAAPDGYTIGIAAVSFLLQPYVTQVAWKSEQDFALLGSVASGPTIAFVRADAPWKTMQDLVEYSRAHPGEVRAGMTGPNSTSQLHFFSVIQGANVDWTFVPFTSEADSVSAVLGNHIDVGISGVGSVVGQLQAGQLRSLVTFEQSRIEIAPDSPTMQELGYTDPAGLSLNLLIGPKALPEPVVQTIFQAVSKAILTDGYKRALAQNTMTLPAANQLSLDGLRAQLRQDSEAYAKAAVLFQRAASN